VTYTIIPVSPTGCADGPQQTVVVTINPTPRIFPVPINSIQCDSTTTNIQLISPSEFTSGVISFNYTVTTTGSVTGFISPTDNLPNNHIIADNLVNQTDHFQEVTYRVVPISPTACSAGPPQDITVTVNPTPRATPVNIKPAICFGGTTEIVLTSPTVMTSGIIKFDYDISFTGVPGDVVGNSASVDNKMQGDKLMFIYKNSAPPSRIDTLNSVLFAIQPKVVGLACPAGNIITTEVQVHPKTIKYNYPGTNGTGILITKQLTCNISSGLAALRVIMTEGADPYHIRWTGPVGYERIDSVEIKNLNIGQYAVKVTDNLGCSNDSIINIIPFTARPQIFAVPVIPPDIHVSCPGGNDGSVRVYVSSGITAPYYFWVVFNNTDTLPGPGVFTGNYNPSDPNTYKVYNNLKAGNYMLVIRDVKGCYIVKNTELKEPAPIKVVFQKSNYSGFDISCRGYSTGSALAQPTGGTGSYSYLWYSATGLPLTVSTTTNLLDSVSAGKYYLITTDMMGCSKKDSVTLYDPPGMDLTDSELSLSPDGITNISCFGGSDGYINMTITGGSGVYTYSWTLNTDPLFTASAEDISGLKAGIYSCTVTDLNGCVLRLNPGSVLPTFELSEPTALDITAIPSFSTDGNFNINCFGGTTGSIDITVTGGSTGTYKYAWSTPDGSGLVAGQEDQNSLTAGTYHLVVSDSNNCIAVKDVILSHPAALEAILTPTDITCFPVGSANGTVTLTVTGGVAPFTYLWSNGATTKDISGLAEGFYKVTVHDFNGCEITTDSVRINLPPPLAYTMTKSDYNGFNISCYGLANGSIQIIMTGGLAPYIFSWTGPDEFIATTKDISNLKAGLYHLLITDSNYCTATEDINLTEPLKLGMTLSLSASTAGGFHINCAGDNTGSIGIEPLNQVKSVDYIWADGIFGKTRTGLQAGDYNVIITDANNCHADSTITLSEPDSLKLIFDISKPFCPDKPDGEIRLNVSGGVMGTDYSYKWSDNSTSNDLSDIPEGFYRVIVTDLNSCSIRDSVYLEPLNETCLVIPNAISPNGDLINDVWNIGMVELYPDMEIKIFNRWGESIWRSEKGYPKPWDGTSNGSYLPIDSYHYIIDLHNGSKVLVGNVTIVR
jgi:gliding motility-associated-like protein